MSAVRLKQKGHALEGSLDDIACGSMDKTCPDSNRSTEKGK